MCRLSDREILSILQEPLPLEPQPFAKYAQRLGIRVDQVIALIQGYLQSGVIRRIAGIVKHDRAGFLFNAMIAFEVEDNQCDSAGEILSAFTCISHCYRRTAYPDWPYNIYAMVHARYEEELKDQLTRIRNSVIHKSATILPSVKEFKKSHYQMPLF